MEFKEDELEKYKSLANQLRIKKEINEIKTDIEKLGVREELEDKNLSGEKEKLELRLDILNEELIDEDMGKFNKEFEIIFKKDEIVNFKNLLSKLEIKKDSISIQVYEKLKEEYQNGLEKSKLFIEDAVKSIREFYLDSSQFLKTYDENKEELELRKNFNEINEDEYNEKLRKMSENKQKAESVLEIATLLLEEFETNI